jgi:hypothetical protein
MTTRRGMKKALARAWDPTLSHAERSRAARHLSRLAAALEQALAQEVREVARAQLRATARERAEA